MRRYAAAVLIAAMSLLFALPSGASGPIDVGAPEEDQRGHVCVRSKLLFGDTEYCVWY